MDKLKDILQAFMIAAMVGVASACFHTYTDLIELRKDVSRLIDSDGNIRPSHRVLILEDRINRLDCVKPSTGLMLLSAAQ